MDSEKKRNAARLIGLTDAQVLESRKKHGANVLTPPPREPLWKKFLEKFGDPLILILIIVGALSVGVSCYEFFALGKPASVFFEPTGIFVAVLLATGLSFVFEQRADREFSILNRVNDDAPVRVFRNGRVAEIPRRDVVVGDTVLIGAGDEIPADGILVDAVMLCVDESSLTGEHHCSKTADASAVDPEATYASNAVLRGTKVLDGHGVFIVEKVGDATENGKVFVEVQIDDSVKTPLNEQLDGLGGVITKISYAFAALIVVGRLILFFSGTPADAGFDAVEFVAYLLQTVMIAVTLVVVAVPEGLPMAVTLSLAYSMRRMLKTNNLVRRMHACETMGAVNVICTDKTGTLTQNRMSVRETYFSNAFPPAAIDESLAANSTAEVDFSSEKPRVIGNPTEGALLVWLKDRGTDYSFMRERCRRVAELPFSAERKFMATVVDSEITGKRTLYVKGAPEIVLAMCRLSADDADDIKKRLGVWQNKAMRTIGFAVKTLDATAGVPALDDVCFSQGSLDFLGIAAIEDPLREDVPAAVRECLDAGIDVKIVTGDTSATAEEIGRRLGLFHGKPDGNAIATGEALSRLSDDGLRSRLGELKVVARARPFDKKRIVEALRESGAVVAVTGDGTNDAPALKAAHVGLSMGTGTSVAKEASDITIIDDSFGSIGRAVMWGRSLYRNIQRFILFQMTVNVAACLIVLAGAFIGTQSPLTVTQMLWVNLIMDTFAAMALASIPPSGSVMRDKPRDRRAFIIDKAMCSRIVGVGGIFFAALIGLIYFFRQTDVACLFDFLCGAAGTPSASHEITLYEQSLFFTIFVMLQFWNMFNARAFGTGRSAFHFKGCGGFVAVAVLILAGQLLIVNFGGKFFNVEPLTLSDWLLVVAGTSPVVLLGELFRLFSAKEKTHAARS